MTRSCPVDQSPLAQSRVAGAVGDVTVDRCGRCGGVFLDADELLHISGDKGLNEALRHRPVLDEPSGRRCPSCGLRMSQESARGVELEVCPKCDGLWLDRGELDRLAARAGAGSAPG